MERILNYTAMKWGLLAVLFLFAPAPVVVFETFLTGPVVFVAATVVSLSVDALGPNGAGGAMIIGFFAVHLTIYVFLYAFVASAFARSLAAVANPRLRGAVFAGLVLVAGGVGFLPLYGGAGLHGGEWGSLAFFLAVLNESHYGPNAVLTIYGPAVFVLGAGAVFYWAKKDRARGGP